jgi:hypothetical protein
MNKFQNHVDLSRIWDKSMLVKFFYIYVYAKIKCFFNQKKVNTVYVYLLVLYHSDYIFQLRLEHQQIVYRVISSKEFNEQMSILLINILGNYHIKVQRNCFSLFRNIRCTINTIVKDMKKDEVSTQSYTKQKIDVN